MCRSYDIRMKLPCCVISPMSVTYDWFNFPKDDSFSGFWTIGALAMGKPVVMIFCLDPHVAAKKVDAEIARLVKEHGMDASITENMIRPDYTGYKPGDTGEFAFNKSGRAPTIDHSKNPYADQVVAKPYPPP